MSEAPEQFLELKRAQAIPLGSLKLLFAIFVIVGALIASVIALYASRQSDLLLVKFYCGIFAGICWLGLLIFAIWTIYSFQTLKPTWPGTWLRKYWHNNLICYDACIHLDKDGEYCTHAVKHSDLFNSHHCNNFTDENRFLIRTSLGGWRNHDINLMLENHNDLLHLENWKIELKRLGSYHENVTIIARDGNGNKLCLEARHFLQAHAHHHKKRRGLAGDNCTLLHHLLEYSHHKYNQWQEEQARANDLNGRFEYAVRIILEATQALRESRRAIQSTEVMRIRKGMEVHLADVLPDDDPRQEQIKPFSEPQPQTP